MLEQLWQGVSFGNCIPRVRRRVEKADNEDATKDSRKVKGITQEMG